VILRDMRSGTLVPNVQLLIDTGADVTLLPRHAVERLGVSLVEGSSYALVGFDGRTSTTQAVDLDMLSLRKAYRGRYLLIDAEHGVLGRDVLSSVVLLFDGPRQMWSEHAAPSGQIDG
jgi:hypothetical protein